MNKTVECMRCRAPMDGGFVPDHTGESGYRQQIWHPGEPQRSFWGLKMKKEEVVPVRTLRCTKCAYLESYAVRVEQGRAR